MMTRGVRVVIAPLRVRAGRSGPVWP
uniref:Uncharacterized protein n=1 Tax=Arundo donax TaxID=35708 RepID=A0A0A9ETQ2_ARUDO